MRHAIIVASSYNESTRLAGMPAAPDDAQLIAQRLSGADAAYTVHTLSADRDLPERLEELLAGLEPEAELLFYFGGYLAWLGSHVPALVLNAARLRAYSLQRLAALFERFSVCPLLLLDVVCVADEGRTPALTADAVCDALDHYPLIEGVIAVRESPVAPTPYGSPFTLLLLRSLDWLSAVRNGSLVTTGDLNQLVQLGHGWLGAIDAIRFSPAAARPILLPGAAVVSRMPVPLSDPPPAPSKRESSGTPLADAGTPGDGDPPASLPPPVESELGGASESAETEAGEAAVDSSRGEALGSAPVSNPKRAESIGPMLAPKAHADPRGDEPSIIISDPPPALGLDDGPSGIEGGGAPTAAGLASADVVVESLPATGAEGPGAKERAATPIPPEPTLGAVPDLDTLEEAAAALEAGSVLAPARDGESEASPSPPAPVTSAQSPEPSGDRFHSSPPRTEGLEWEAGQVELDPGTGELALEQCIGRGQELLKEGRVAAALTVLERAAELTEDSVQLRELHGVAATAARNLGDGARALAHYEAILRLDPLDSTALFWATEILSEQGNWDRVAELQAAHLRALATDEERAQLLATQVGLWLDAAQDFRRGREALEELARLRPHDYEVLDRLSELLEQLGEFDEAIRVRRRLAFKLSEEPARRGEVLIGAARLARDRLGKIEFAIDLAEQALRADPGAIGALDFVATVLVEREEWPLLAKSYEAVLDKLTDGPVALDLAMKTAMLCRDKLKDSRRAAQALARAATIEPHNADLRAQLCDQLIAAQQHEAAAPHCQVALQLQPRVLAHYRRAYAIYTALGRHDQAWSAAHALDYLGDADINESLHSDLHRPDGLLPVVQCLTEAEWASAALNPDLDPAIRHLLSVVAEPAISLQLDALTKSRKLLHTEPRFFVDPETSTTTLAQAFRWTCRLLGLPPPELYVYPELAGGLTTGPTRTPVSLVSKTLGSGLELPELAFLWARHLTVHRPEYRLVLFFATVEQLTTLVTASFAAWDWTPRKAKIYDPELRRLAQGLHERLGDSGRERLRSATAGLSLGEAEGRLLAWVRAVELVAVRVGLLACGDLHVACELVQRFPQGKYTSAYDQVSALMPFKLSEEYVRLRAHLGVQVTG